MKMVSPTKKTLLLTTLINIAAPALAVDNIISTQPDTPYAAKYPQVDSASLYLFNSYETGRDDYIVLMANYNPLQQDYSGLNSLSLDDTALYEIHIDNTGNAIEDITFQFQFDNATSKADLEHFEIGTAENKKSIPSVMRKMTDANTSKTSNTKHRESYKIIKVTGNRRAGTSELITSTESNQSIFAKPLDYTSVKTLGDYKSYNQYADQFIHTINIPDCAHEGRVFVGQRTGEFKAALGEVFDSINFLPIEADSLPGSGDTDGFPGGISQNSNRNEVSRDNVTTLALEIHKSCLTGNGNGVIGAWTTASLPRTAANTKMHQNDPEAIESSWIQVSRLGNPLINELMISFPDKAKFAASMPKDDVEFLDYITHPVLPAIFNALFKDVINSTLNTTIPDLAPSNIPRHDLVTAFLKGFVNMNQLAMVTQSDILRLNTNTQATSREDQHTLGTIAGDAAGYPNGRRPGDDIVDITLRFIMGKICYDLPMGSNSTLSNLGLCKPSDASIGDVALTDGVPVSAMDFDNSFPYLISPYPGSPAGVAMPTPKN